MGMKPRCLACSQENCGYRQPACDCDCHGKTEPKPLEPPDPKQCQTTITESHGPFVLGPRPDPKRCANKPVVIVVEKEADEYGRKGSMSLCSHCLTVFLDQGGYTQADFEEVPDAQA